jgi:hypothetical protein
MYSHSTSMFIIINSQRSGKTPPQILKIYGRTKYYKMNCHRICYSALETVLNPKSAENGTLSFRSTLQIEMCKAPIGYNLNFNFSLKS